MGSRQAILTVPIAAMLALGTVTRHSGLDVALGLTFARTMLLYPFFAALPGGLGVALTGSDIASNVIFGGLQKVSAEQLGLSLILMAATNWFGHEGTILHFVFRHSIILACLVAPILK
jgi:lactate permease